MLAKMPKTNRPFGVVVHAFVQAYEKNTQRIEAMIPKNFLNDIPSEWFGHREHAPMNLPPQVNLE